MSLTGIKGSCLGRLPGGKVAKSRSERPAAPLPIFASLRLAERGLTIRAVPAQAVDTLHGPPPLPRCYAAMMGDVAATPWRARVITVSDRGAAGTREDVSGPRVAAVLREEGFKGCDVVVVPDDVQQITSFLREAAALGFDLVVTTGGTGLAPRDVTPEATIAICDRMVPGLAEMMRADGLKHTRFAPLSRGVCGIIGTTLVLNLPGSPAGAESSIRAVQELLPHALRLLAGHTEH